MAKKGKKGGWFGEKVRHSEAAVKSKAKKLLGSTSINPHPSNTPGKGVSCRDLPDRIGRFEKDDCIDDEIITYCTWYKNALIYIEAIKHEIGNEKWTVRGLADVDGSLTEFELGSVDTMAFSDEELPKEMKSLVESFDDEVMLEETLNEVRRR